MSLRQEQYKKIIRYNDGTMKEAEKNAFESELSKNEELQQAIKLYKKLLTVGNSVKLKVQAIYEAHMDDLEGSRDDEAENMIKHARENWELQNKDAFQQPPGKVRKLNTWKVLAIASIITGLVSASSLYFFHNNKNTDIIVTDKGGGGVRSKPLPSTGGGIALGIGKQPENQEDSISSYKINEKKRDELFADNFRADKKPGNFPDALQDAFAYYAATQYKDAIAAFEKVNPTYGSRGGVKDSLLFYKHYYSALSYLAEKDASKAIPPLEQAIKEDHGKPFTFKIQWYLALAYLKNGDYQKSADLLNQLARSKKAGTYRKKAIKLKNQLLKIK